MPIWIGGVGQKRTLEMVAKWATGSNAAYVSTHEFRRLSGVLDQHRESIGRAPGTIERSINLTFDVGKNEAALVAQWGRYVGASRRRFAQRIGRSGERAHPGVPGRGCRSRQPRTACSGRPDLLEQYLTELARALRADSAPHDS